MEGPVAILGAGTIGASWAGLFLAHGYDVRAWDPAPGFAERLQAAVRPIVADCRNIDPALPEPGKLTCHGTAAEAVQNCAFVQESGPEKLDAKRALLAAIAPALRPDVVIASSTSSITASELQPGVALASRLLIGHPFNPPHLIPLVEVVAGEATDDAVVTAALAFYRSLGRSPVLLRQERRGHLGNRLQAALWREAIAAVLEGIASVEDVDTVVTHGIGLRWAAMGPHATFHLGGGAGGMAQFLAHLGDAFQQQFDALAPVSLTPEVRSALARAVEAGYGDPSALAQKRDVALRALLQAKRGIEG